MVTVSVKLRNGLVFCDVKTFHALDMVKPSFKYAYRECVWGRYKSFILNELLSDIFLAKRDLKDPLVGDSQHLD